VADMTSAPGPSEIGTWQNQIIKPGAVISQTGAAVTGADPQAIELYNMPKEKRREIALALSNAGYNVPTGGEFSESLLNAFTNATLAAKTMATRLGMPFNSEYFSTFLAQETAAGGAGGPRVTKSVRIADEFTAKALIDAVFEDQLGRKATDKETRKYTAALQKAQRGAPTVTTSTGAGGGVSSVTTGGINEQQFLIDQIAGTDEGQRQRVVGFYDTFKKALGVA